MMFTFSTPETTRDASKRTSTSAQDEILRVAATDAAMGLLTGSEADRLGRDGVARLVKEIAYDVQTRRLRAYGN